MANPLPSWLPYGWLHTIIGALPAIAHPAPEEVAVIGLGSGDSAWAAACRQETRRLVVFEIASSQPQLLRRVAAKPTLSRLQRFLSDPRITIVKDDGRRRLQADGRKYDIIVADAIDPDHSMITYLYSVEYYRLVRDTLKPGGLICVLAKTSRIRASLHRAFPFAVYFREDFFLASAQPITIDKEAWLARLESPRIVDYVGKSRMRQIRSFVEQAHYAPPPPSLTAEVIQDLEPRDEFVRP